MLVDVNVLLHAVNGDDPRHAEARGWLERTLTGRDVLGFAWFGLIGFVRLATKPTVFREPLSPDGALRRVRGWLAHPGSVIVQPTERHLDILDSLLASVGTAGNLANDAHLAALAIEHDATIISYDHDFARFVGVRWERPSEG